MTKLPVFRTIGQGMAVFGLHFGKLFKWALVPLFLGGGVLGAALGLAAWRGGLGGGLNPWLAPVAVAALFALQTFVPFAIRVNQLAVLGRVENSGYVEMIFAPRSLRYMGYAVIVTLIMAAGTLISVAPLVAYYAMKLAGGPVVSFAAFAVLLVSFFVLTSPLNLILPAVSVEREPSLNKAYNLGARNKLRLILAIFLSTALFTVLTQAVELGARALGGKDGETLTVLVALPLQIFLGFFSYVTSVAVPAVAYRVLSGLPEPGAEPAPAAQGPVFPPAPGVAGEAAAQTREEAAKEGAESAPAAQPGQPEAQAPAADAPGVQEPAPAEAPGEEASAVEQEQAAKPAQPDLQPGSKPEPASEPRPSTEPEPEPAGPSAEPVKPAQADPPRAAQRQVGDRVSAAVTAAVERMESETGKDPSPKQ